MERRWRAFAEFIVRPRRPSCWASVVAISARLAVLGIPQLEFATGQDSYLNDDEQTAIDNVEYQDLFGGQAMLTLFTMDEGTTVVDLFTPDNIDQIEAMTDGHPRRPTTSPRSSRPSRPCSGPPTSSKGARPAWPPGSCSRPIEREDDPEAAATRTSRHAGHGRTTRRRRRADLRQSRLRRVPPRRQRRATSARHSDRSSRSRPASSPRSRTPPTPAWSCAWAATSSIEEEGAAAAGRRWTRPTAATFDNATDLDDRRAGAAQGHQRLPPGRHAHPRRPGRADHGRRPARSPSACAGDSCRSAVVLVGVLWAFAIFGLVGLRLSLVTISGLPILIGLGIDFAIQVQNRVHEELQLQPQRQAVPGDDGPHRPAVADRHDRRRAWPSWPCSSPGCP